MWSKRDIGAFIYIFLLLFIVYFLVFLFISLMYVPFVRWLQTNAAYSLPTIPELIRYGKAVLALTVISSIGLWCYQKMQSRR